MQPLLQLKSSIIYSEHSSVTLCTQHAMHMCHIFICGLPSSEIFFHFISKMAKFQGGEKKVLNIKCVLIFSTTFV